MLCTYYIRESGQPQCRSDKLFVKYPLSAVRHGAQTKNALPTGTGRAGKAGDTDSRHSFAAMPGTVEGIGRSESYSSPRASRSASSFMIAGYFLSS